MGDFCQLGPDLSALEILDVSIAVAALAVTTILGIHGISKLFFGSQSTKMYSIFKWLFVLTIIFTLTICIATIIATIMCSQSRPFAVFVSTIFVIIPYHLLTLMLDITLYARLYYVFQSTQYKINQCYFRSLITATFIASIVGMIGASLYLSVIHQVYVTHNFLNLEQNAQRAILIAIIGHVSYIVLSLWGLTLFTKNLNALTENAMKNKALDQSNVHKTTVSETSAAAQSSSAMHSNTELNLNKQQMKFMYQQTKYLVLLSIALFSSLMLYVLILIQGFFGPEYLQQYSLQVNTVFEGVDITINVVCLYFQYSFGKPYYTRFCGACDRLCFGILERRMKMNHWARMQGRTVDEKNLGDVIAVSGSEIKATELTVTPQPEMTAETEQQSENMSTD